MPTVQEIIHHIESIAPRAYQEDYDNAGLIVGDPQREITGIITSLDAVESVVDEAIANGANLIIAHHPIVFRGLKSLTGKNYIERTVLKAIKNDIAIYASHTNLDSVQGGVNWKICEMLGIQHPKILAPKAHTLRKLTTFVPHSHKEALLQALSHAGAGNIGNYSQCSFTLIGQGTFLPNESANPHIGQQGALETVEETRLEVIFPFVSENAVMRALHETHPYEEVAYYLHKLENTHQEIGSGAIGELATLCDEAAFLQLLKDRLGTACVRHTAPLGKPIKRVAVCGGAGSFLLRKAMAVRADVLVTADFKYHEFFDADGQILIADVGHFESEAGTIILLADLVRQQFPDVRIQPTEVVTNPVQYY